MAEGGVTHLLLFGARRCCVSRASVDDRTARTQTWRGGAKRATAAFHYPACNFTAACWRRAAAAAPCYRRRARRTAATSPYLPGLLYPLRDPSPAWHAHAAARAFACARVARCRRRLHAFFCASVLAARCYYARYRRKGVPFYVPSPLLYLPPTLPFRISSRLRLHEHSAACACCICLLHMYACTLHAHGVARAACRRAVGGPRQDMAFGAWPGARGRHAAEACLYTWFCCRRATVPGKNMAWHGLVLWRSMPAACATVLLSLSPR